MQEYSCLRKRHTVGLKNTTQKKYFENLNIVPCDFRITRRYDTNAAPILKRELPLEVDSIFRKPSCLQLQDYGRRCSHITMKTDTEMFSEMLSPFPYGVVTSKTESTSTACQNVITPYSFTPSIMAENVLQSSTESPNALNWQLLRVHFNNRQCQIPYVSTCLSFNCL